METAKHTPWEVAGAAIYKVNANGTNRLYAHVQPGTADDGERVGDEERHKAAAKLARACNSHDALVGALQLARKALFALADETSKLIADDGCDPDLNDKWNELGYGYETLQAIDAALAAAGVKSALGPGLEK